MAALNQSDLNGQITTIRNETVPQANTAQRVGTVLQNISDTMFYLSNSVTPMNPEGVAFSTAPGTPTLTASGITETASVVNNNGTAVNIAQQTIGFSLASAGMKRVDAIVVKYNDPAGYERVAGQEVPASNPVAAPAIPSNRLFVRYLLVTDNSATSSTDLSGKANRAGDVFTGTIGINKAAAHDNAHLYILNPDISGKTNDEQRAELVLHNSGMLTLRNVTHESFAIMSGNFLHINFTIDDNGNAQFRGNVWANGVLLGQPAPPEGVEWITRPATPAISGTSVSIGSGSLNNDGTTVNIGAATLTFALAATGKERRDAIAAPITNPSAWALITGPEFTSGGNAVYPVVPATSAILTFLEISDTAAGTPGSSGNTIDTLTTTGTSGPATYDPNTKTLNIPQYGAGAPAADGNNYTNALSFDIASRVLTLGREGMTNLTATIPGGEVTAATAAEINTGTDNAKVITPAGLNGSAYIRLASVIVGYAKSATNRALAATDTLLTALGILEKKADDNAANIGTLTSLTTTDKTNIVAAINEVNAKPGGSGGEAFTALTIGATTTWATGGKYLTNRSLTLTMNTTLAFTGLVNGAEGSLVLIQDGTGNRTFTPPAGSLPTTLIINGAANSITFLGWKYDGSRVFWTNKNY